MQPRDASAVAGGRASAGGSHHPEDVAFRARVKPALRASLGTEALHVAVERYHGLGAATAVSEAVPAYDGEPLRILYVAWTAAEARELRDAEAPLLARHVRAEVRAASVRAMGHLLGYPRCCVEHFLVSTARWDAFAGRRLRWAGVALRARLPPAWRWTPSAPAAVAPRPLRHPELVGVAPDAQDYLAAREVYTPRPDALLNHLVMAARAHLVSFYPCSYHCPAARAVARATLDALDQVEPGAGGALLARLARPVVLGACDGRAVVEIQDEPGGGGRVRAAEAPAAPGRPALPADAALARRSVGARIDAQGWVHGVARPGEARAFLMDFRLAAHP